MDNALPSFPTSGNVAHSNGWTDYSSITHYYDHNQLPMVYHREYNVVSLER